MAKSVYTRRRQFGTACLTGAAAMLILGQTLLSGYLDGMGFILYWFACLVLTVLTLLAALLDVQAVRRHAQEQQRDLVRDALKKIDADERKDPD
ncbi:MAG: hypothetical protein HY298_00005 [Verrucomicrobia bacterium]|nr:hypothetical protein [Verrucomicrobiota bacterium]